MSNHYYQAHFLTPEGEDVKQLYFLPSKQEVRLEVARHGGVLQSIKEEHISWANKEFYSKDFKIAFFKALSFHMEVGTSAGQSMVHVIDAQANRTKRLEMQPALEVLARGGRFSDAVGLLVFADPAVIAILQAGDAAGSVRDAIDDVIKLLESGKGSMKLLLGALVWLVIDFFSMISTIFSIHFYMLPWLIEHGPKIEDPAAAATYQSKIALAQHISLALTVSTTLGCAAITVLITLMFFGSSELKARIYDWCEKMPMLRKVFIDGALSDGCLMLSRMMRNGMPIARGLEVLAAFSTVHSVSAFWRTILAAFDGGADTRKAFEAGGLLSPQELIILAAHQNRNHLVTLLQSMATYRREQCELGNQQLVRVSVLGMIGYMGVVMAFVFWLVQLQDLGVTGSLSEALKG